MHYTVPFYAFRFSLLQEISSLPLEMQLSISPSVYQRERIFLFQTAQIENSDL